MQGKKRCVFIYLYSMALSEHILEACLPFFRSYFCLDADCHFINVHSWKLYRKKTSKENTLAMKYITTRTLFHLAQGIYFSFNISWTRSSIKKLKTDIFGVLMVKWNDKEQEWQTGKVIKVER